MGFPIAATLLLAAAATVASTWVLGALLSSRPQSAYASGDRPGLRNSGARRLLADVMGSSNDASSESVATQAAPLAPLGEAAPYSEDVHRPRVLPRILAELEHMQQMHEQQKLQKILLDRIEAEVAEEPAEAPGSTATEALLTLSQAEQVADAAVQGATKPSLLDCMSTAPVKPYTLQNFVDGKPTM